MKLELSLVPFGHISGAIPKILPFINKSAVWSRGRATADDILRFVINGSMQLWVVFEATERKVYGHLITEVKQYPQCKMLVIQYCAIEPNHMVHVEDKMQDLAETFAKDNECAGIEFVGRPGWGKHMKKYGYNVQSVMYQRFFKG